MQRITDATAAGTLPAPSSTGSAGYFSDGNPATSVPATLVTQDWLNGVQEEIINVIEAASLTPSITDNTQLKTAIQDLITSAVSGASGSPYDIAGGAGGSINGSQVVLYTAVGRACTFTGCQAKMLTAPTAALTFTVTVNGTTVATINFAAGSASGAITFSSGTSFSAAAGDALEITAQGSPDSTAAGLALTLVGATG